jgi:hypothetical protein
MRVGRFSAVDSYAEDETRVRRNAAGQTHLDERHACENWIRAASFTEVADLHGVNQSAFE